MQFSLLGIAGTLLSYPSSQENRLLRLQMKLFG